MHGSVYPGDSITSTFSLDTSTSTWTDTWSLTPGTTGTAAGQTAQSGTLSNNFGKISLERRDRILIRFQPAKGYLTRYNHLLSPESGLGADMIKAVLAIELQSGAVWDFGKVQWTNLAITASTTATAWCTSGYVLGTCVCTHH
jgi:hypothetical protein